MSLADNWFQQAREHTLEKKRDDKSATFDTSPYKVPSVLAESEEAISLSDGSLLGTGSPSLSTLQVFNSQRRRSLTPKVTLNSKIGKSGKVKNSGLAKSSEEKLKKSGKVSFKSTKT